MELRKRKLLEMGVETTHRLNEWPWQVIPNSATKTTDDSIDLKKWRYKQPKFSTISYWNQHLDKNTMRAAIKVSESVVSLVSYSDDKVIFRGTGTIIEDDGTILTSAKVITRKNKVAEKIKVIVYLLDGKSYEAQVLVHNFYYGIAVVKIKHDDVPQFKSACLRPVDDCCSLERPVHDDKGSELCSHAYNLVPGDNLIVIGRYFIKPYDLMAAPGEFSIKRSGGDLEWKGLFRSTCLITPAGVGGPIVNQNGEVIGVVPCDRDDFTPFVPINISLKWWKYAKAGILPPLPLLGMKMANLYTTDLQVLEKLIRKYPDNFAGVIVEEVIQGSSADIAGLCTDDLIVQCCGKTIQSFLELYDMMWDKTGDSVVLKVIRASEDKPLLLSMKVDVADS